MAVLPLVVVVGMFPTSFTPPFGRKFTKETITFTASDAFILIVACSYGVFPAVVIAGFDAFISSLRTVRRLSSNLFSAGMISLSAAMGGYGLYVWGSYVVAAVAIAIEIAAVRARLSAARRTQTGEKEHR